MRTGVGEDRRVAVYANRLEEGAEIFEGQP